VALREDQVLRYSRSILLRGVGGQGQEALLATGVRLTSGGPALLTAAAYLGASGSPVEGPPGGLEGTDAGFLVEGVQAGLPAAPAVRAALSRLNPDASARAASYGTLLGLPGACDSPRPLVALGVRDGRWEIWGAGSGACGGCLSEAVRGAGPPGTGPDAVQAGTLAALLFQRLVLGLGPQLSGVGLLADGAMEGLDAPACTHVGHIPGDVLALALRHLESRYPEEGCGVVLRGPGGTRWVAMRNAYASWAARDPKAFPRDARSAFVFEPTDWLGLLREADVQRETVLCVVHAHPDGRAAFSAEDAAQAAPDGIPLLPGVGYLVVAVVEGRAEAATWTRWQDGGFREEPFLLSE
jgi:proteasome lid subunit RPN8/RPN11